MKKQIFTLLVISFLILTRQQIRAQKFTPRQDVQNASIVLDGKIDDVFPLFTVLGEKKWAVGWNPDLIFPASGSMQEGLIFQTPDHVTEAPPLIWVVSRYDTISYRIQYTVTSPIRVVIITVSCATLDDGRTKAEINYKLTGLNKDGEELSHHLIAKLYANNLKDWETAINSYLRNLK